jgi:hypothetical protein
MFFMSIHPVSAFLHPSSLSAVEVIEQSVYYPHLLVKAERSKLQA